MRKRNGGMRAGGENGSVLDCLDERMKAEIEAIDRVLVKLEARRYGRCAG